MRCRRRVDHERLGIADVGEMAHELNRFDEALAGLRAGMLAAPDAEGHDAAGAARQIALRCACVAVTWERRVSDPIDERMFHKMLRDGERRLAMARHAQM